MKMKRILSMLLILTLCIPVFSSASVKAALPGFEDTTIDYMVNAEPLCSIKLTPRFAYNAYNVCPYYRDEDLYQFQSIGDGFSVSVNHRHGWMTKDQYGNYPVCFMEYVVTVYSGFDKAYEAAVTFICDTTGTIYTYYGRYTGEEVN